MMPLIIAALLGLSAMFIVLYPLLGLETQPETTARTSETDEAAEHERLAKRALRDVDFDYRLGNLGEGDYEALRERYERRALAAMRTRYEREQALDTLIDQQLAALREKRRGADRAEPSKSALQHNGRTADNRQKRTERTAGQAEAGDQRFDDGEEE